MMWWVVALAAVAVVMWTMVWVLSTWWSESGSECRRSPHRPFHPPIYLTMSTIPDRLVTPEFRRNVDRLLDQGPTGLLINIPLIHNRTGRPYVLPDWLASGYYRQARVVRCERDDGPLTKIVGGIDTLPDDVAVANVDDDLLYHPFLVKELHRAYTEHPDRVTCFHLHPETYGWGTLPEGYAGCVTRSQHMKRVARLPRFEGCKWIDDHYLAWAYRKLGLTIANVDDRPWSWYHVFDLEDHNRRHEWDELKSGEETGRRDLLQFRCREEIDAWESGGSVWSGERKNDGPNREERRES